MLIMATGQTVWVILTEGGRILITGVIVPCAAWKIHNWVPTAIETITITGPWILLTVGVQILLTGDQIFPGTIRLSKGSSQKKRIADLRTRSQLALTLPPSSSIRTYFN